MEKMENSNNPEWERMEADLVLRLRLLRGAWEATQDKPIHPQMVRDLYMPALRLLAEFCACIDIGKEQNSGDQNGKDAV